MHKERCCFCGHSDILDICLNAKIKNIKIYNIAEKPLEK